MQIKENDNYQFKYGLIALINKNILTDMSWI